jgi:hypothetical protein
MTTTNERNATHIIPMFLITSILLLIHSTCSFQRSMHPTKLAAFYLQWKNVRRVMRPFRHFTKLSGDSNTNSICVEEVPVRKVRSSKFAYGVSSIFSEKSKDMFKVDKSHYIHQYEKLGSRGELPPAAFSHAPKRFGKSTFVNMLEAYYDCLTPSSVNNACKDLAAWEYPSALQGKYHVLRLDLSSFLGSNVSGILTEKEIEKRFAVTLRKSCEDFLWTYGYPLDKRFDDSVDLFEHCMKTASKVSFKMQL